MTQSPTNRVLAVPTSKSGSASVRIPTGEPVLRLAPLAEQSALTNRNRDAIVRHPKYTDIGLQVIYRKNSTILVPGQSFNPIIGSNPEACKFMPVMQRDIKVPYKIPYLERGSTLGMDVIMTFLPY